MSLTEPLISEILWTALKQFLPAAVTQTKTMALSPLEAIAFSVSEIDVVSGPQSKTLGAIHGLRLKDNNQWTALVSEYVF